MMKRAAFQYAVVGAFFATAHLGCYQMIPLDAEGDAGEERNGASWDKNDFTPYGDKLQDQFGLIFEGVIEDGDAYAPCRYEGHAFGLSLMAPDEMSCFNSETQEDAPCDNASGASLDLEGLLEIADAPDIGVAGHVTVSASPGSSMSADFYLDYLDADSPFTQELFGENLEEIDIGDDIDKFVWEGRLSDDGASKPIWEVCFCVVHSTNKRKSAQL